MEELDYQQKFEQLFTTHIRREGAEQLLEWLKKTDFFTAPASTKYHCACQHGLVMHSISVFETMMDRFFEEGDSMESFAICARCVQGAVLQGQLPQCQKPGDRQVGGAALFFHR